MSLHLLILLPVILLLLSWVVILKIKLFAYRKQETAIIDALLLFARHDYMHVHEFVQSLKQILNGEQ